MNVSRSPRRVRVLLKTLHLWLGLSLGVVLSLVCMAGSVLMFEDPLVAAMHPELIDRPSPDLGVQGKALQTIMASSEGKSLRSISLPDDDFPVFEGALPGRGKIYFDGTTGEVVLRRSGSSDPLLLLMDWHTHLLSGKIGETVLGCVALTGLFMILSGVWLYWPGRRRALTHLRPHARPPIQRWASWHRFVGVMALPLLLVMIGTGTTMAYRGSVRAGLMSLFGEPPSQRPPDVPWVEKPVNWSAVLVAAQEAAPDAQISRLNLPARDGAALVVRLRRPGEWNPTGRSTLWMDAPAARVLGGEDATRAGTGSRISNALFPIHSAAVGGMLWRVVASFTGLLPMFMLVTGFLFWRARRNRPPGRALG
ncbi:putative iron-regulated membrane protein [Luteibacter sp. Sphag1AF]|uniref:PepSY-associated TM helix domain-containing protein n=1 Tax=Luteibacter sp. Sphag1AF TaxID=2587031 RepID=UPI001607C98F|nr:PepSY-associated TM helix domain-containing protein [Luteibacter sp. Sphag1AF]MBB3226745.1 putative iron-regulated membrane protein [Luteibacter sp. Sphag1AF]